MSLLNEYIQMFKQGLKNPDKVLEGRINAIKLTHGHLSAEEQAEILHRRDICASCPYSSSNAVSNPALNYQTQRPDEHCILCKCPIEYKTASLHSECGIAIWNRNNPQNQMPLKWGVYIPKTNN